MTRLAPILLLLSACAESPPELLIDEGDPCRATYSVCIDDELVRECVDEVWTVRTCEDSCAEQGPAMLSEGCAETPTEGCVCVPEPGACAPGSTACESDNTLGYCDDQQVWSTFDCDELCAASLATPTSTGCAMGEDEVAACWCVA